MGRRKARAYSHGEKKLSRAKESFPEIAKAAILSAQKASGAVSDAAALPSGPAQLRR